MKKNEKFIDIVFPNSLRQHFTYKVPDIIECNLYPGQRVAAKLRNNSRIGFIVNIHTNKPSNFKPLNIDEIIDISPLIPLELFSFLQIISRYYLAPLGKVLESAIPTEYRLQNNRIISSLKKPHNPVKFNDIYQKINLDEHIKFNDLKHIFEKNYLHTGILFLKKNGFISEISKYFIPNTKAVKQTIIELSDKYKTESPSGSIVSIRAKKQWQIIKHLQKHKYITNKSDFSFSALNILEDKKIINITINDITLNDMWQNFTVRNKSVLLNNYQLNAFKKINETIQSAKYKGFLLYGVTGSGKTEIYLKLINEVMVLNKSSIILVPEITLTTHLASRFRGEFGDNVAIWHSNLSKAQRSRIWQNVASGNIKIIIGARSALFLPAKNLGLIVVDEEHDSSFKQKGIDPKYHARDAALIRGRESNAAVVLGSATPSLESHYNIIFNKLEKLELPNRFSNTVTPLIHIVDLKKVFKDRNNPDIPFTQLLLDKIQEKLELQQQILLLQNRRGYSNVILCQSCGWTPHCKNCDISLTYHKNINKIMCHYCEFTTNLPEVCPKCGNSEFLFPGFGTQKVEQILKTHFPEAITARMDIDTTRKKGYSQKTMKDFEDNKIQILIGTQMIAKGLDFPNIALVGIMNADIGLYLPDFRARERVFQLLYQVSGRTGRGEIPGEIVIQSYNPEDFTVKCAIQKDIVKFINHEYSERNQGSYPPFARIAIIIFSDIDLKKTTKTAKDTTSFLKNHSNSQIQILGPAPAPIEKIKNRYRYFTLLKSRKDSDPFGNNLRNLLNNFISSKEYQRLSRQAKISIDIDPMDLL